MCDTQVPIVIKLRACLPESGNVLFLSFSTFDLLHAGVSSFMACGQLGDQQQQQQESSNQSEGQMGPLGIPSSRASFLFLQALRALVIHR